MLHLNHGAGPLEGGRVVGQLAAGGGGQHVCLASLGEAAAIGKQGHAPRLERGDHVAEVDSCLGHPGI